MSRTSLLRSALIWATALALVLAAAPARAEGGAPLRILLTGDSITQGFHGDYTWRYRFAKELTRQGVSYDLVGSRRSPNVKPGFTTAQYLDPDFDTDHFALTGSPLGTEVQRIDNEINAQHPDVVVLASGINNLRSGATPTQTDKQLRNWIVAARSARADVKIILSPVLEATDATRPGLHRAITDYDALLARTATELSTHVSPITVADTTRGWTAAADTSEDLHPNATGETLIAQRIAETFHRLGYLPQQPDIFRTTVWNRNPRVAVAFNGQRAVLRWDSQAISSARVYLRRGPFNGYASPVRFRNGTMTTSALVPGAVYEFRVALIRGRMASPFGPVTRATVPLPSKPAAVPSARIDAAGIHWTSASGATSYRVQFKKRHRKRWVTRTTTGLTLRVKKVQMARVVAVNAGGRSPVRVVRR